ncbi:Phosphomannomutase [Candidatus Zixiibacteriota bacterium]|nr:Phosphomannomutase [candidate division Zixibacteria bacterium]
MNKQLMVSTSGIRGVIGNGLDPVLASEYAAAFGTYLKSGTVVIGRDSRPSGEMIKMAVIAALRGTGIDVIDIGIVPTPTVEIAVTGLKAKGGICITASHNPSEWNALKLFNSKGEFINKDDLTAIKEIISSREFAFKDYRKLGKSGTDGSWIKRHIDQILKLKVINATAVKRARLKVVVDAVNGAGSSALPDLLEKLGVRVIRINCKGDGNFVHKPEPIPENLKMLMAAVKKNKVDLGMACDPDADRLALVDESGRAIGEEMTLALAISHVLAKKKGNVVVNLSTSHVSEAAASQKKARIFYTPVGEANVVEGMRKHRAIIGGEGNGGVIYPAFHSGRDALVGAAIILSYLSESKMSLSQAAAKVPIYYNRKTKAALPDDFEGKMARVEEQARKDFENLQIDRRDGIRFDFPRGWFQIRRSNTEPIYRLITETDSKKLTDVLISEIMNLLK